MGKTLKELEEKLIICQKCQLSKMRNKVVFGDGSSEAEIMLIGEGPGANEDRSGQPFCGSAGKVLDEMLASIKLARKDIYITNVVKCRPPKNRDPLPAEVEACRRYLDEQIRIIKPKLLVLLGRHAMDRFIKKKTIGKAHGVLFRNKAQGRYYYPVFHPASALYNPSLKDVIRKDFLKIPKLLQLIATDNKKSSGKEISRLAKPNKLI